MLEAVLNDLAELKEMVSSLSSPWIHSKKEAAKYLRKSVPKLEVLIATKEIAVYVDGDGKQSFHKQNLDEYKKSGKR